MNTLLSTIKDIVPKLLEHVQLHISLEGWPAAAAVFAISGGAVAVYAIKSHDRKQSGDMNGDAQIQQADQKPTEQLEVAIVAPVLEPA